MSDIKYLSHLHLILSNDCNADSKIEHAAFVVIAGDTFVETVIIHDVDPHSLTSCTLQPTEYLHFIISTTTNYN